MMTIFAISLFGCALFLSIAVIGHGVAGQHRRIAMILRQGHAAPPAMPDLPRLRHAQRAAPSRGGRVILAPARAAA